MAKPCSTRAASHIKKHVPIGHAECYQPDSNSNASMPDAWRIPQEIVMEIGDNIEDFQSVTQEDAKLDALLPHSPKHLILLPNPMYGSW